ncbi:MAG: GNAT family N-acetyltransferase [Candidatus Hodarchaeales archaeon]|jgi:ribosomal-protein-alanine N-acetyltransferase
MRSDFPNRFETERLKLRPYQDGDDRIFLEMLNKGNREYLDELLGPISQTMDINEVKTYLNQLVTDWFTKKRFVLSYWSKNSIEYLGHIWIEPKNWELFIFEIGWFVVIDKQGKGFPTEATRCALKFLFRHLKAQKVIVTVRDHGEYKVKSIKIAKKCGFIQEGFSRNSVQIFNFKGPGAIVGVYHFGLLRSEAIQEGFLEE